MFNKGIFVNTVIPGYINTEKFNIKAPKFLITSPKKTAKIIYKAIKNKKEIVYINFFWRIIMFVISSLKNTHLYLNKYDNLRIYFTNFELYQNTRLLYLNNEDT